MRAASRFFLLPLLVATLLIPAFNPGRSEEPARRVAPSGLPLPRFVSLDSDKVNVRAGPGVRYPIAWIFVRRGMPLEVTAEFDQWRKVRDIDGAGGWAHRSLLTGRRSAIVRGAVRTLFREPSESSLPVLFAEPGVQGRLLECGPEWCRVRIAGLKGWLPRAQIWGVMPREVFD